MTTRRRRSRHATHLRFRRYGEHNGRSKLADAQVVWLREIRAKSILAGTPVPFHELAALFGIHPRTAQRICRGLKRPHAGGPIEIDTGQNRDDAPNPDMQFNARLVIRCRICRCRAHPSTKFAELCAVCAQKQPAGAWSQQFAG